MVQKLTELRLLPKNFPSRVVTVNNWGAFIVPRHIVRIDSPGHSDKSGTHGWQVRYSGTKFFSDSLLRDRCRTPVSALSLAIELLARRYQGQAVPLRLEEHGSKSEKTGVPGVRIVRRLNNRDFEEVYVEVGYPAYGKSPFRLYVGTANTATQARLDAALERARELRQKLVLEHLEMRQEESLHKGIFLRSAVG